MSDDVIRTKLDAFAVKIAEDAQVKDVPFATRLDAFKALTAYYVGTTKLVTPKKNKDEEPEENEGLSFTDLKKRVEDAGSDLA